MQAFPAITQNASCFVSWSTVRRITLRLFLAAGFLGTGMTNAVAEPFTADVVSTKKTIDPGSNVLLSDCAWDGASQIHVYGQDNLNYKGAMPAGVTAQITLSANSKTLYVLSDFPKRMTYGPIESVVQVYDINTLSRKTEFTVPDKAIKANGMDHMIELSADERLLYIQNATPATSVTVVSLETQKVLMEIPAPGCFGIYPSLKGHQFSTLCGTGEVKTFKLKGNTYTTATAAKIFDAENPVYIHTERRRDGDIILATYGGDIHLINDSDSTTTLTKTISFNEGVQGHWAPGGVGVIAYNTYHDIVFVLMHAGAFEGSHKKSSDEIWAYSLKDNKLVSRSPAENLISLCVTADENPVIFASNSKDTSVDKYTVNDKNRFTFVKTGTDKKAGYTTTLAITHD